MNIECGNQTLNANHSLKASKQKTSTRLSPSATEKYDFKIKKNYDNIFKNRHKMFKFSIEKL